MAVFSLRVTLQNILSQLSFLGSVQLGETKLEYHSSSKYRLREDLAQPQATNPH